MLILSFGIGKIRSTTRELSKFYVEAKENLKIFSLFSLTLDEEVRVRTSPFPHL